jgi:hypothetical protein
MVEAPGLHLYGTEASTVSALPGADVEITAGLTEAMVRFAVRHEYARTVEDVLARRSRLLFLDAHVAATTGRFRTWHNQCGTLLCGNAVQATDANQPLYVQNQGPSFNGTDQHMSIAHSANQLMTGGFTLACSIRPAADAFAYLFAKAASGTSIDGFRLFLNGSTGLTVTVNNGGNVASSTVLTTDEWQHWMVTVSAAGAVTFYRNNVAAGTGSTGATGYTGATGDKGATGAGTPVIVVPPAASAGKNLMVR